ncbi:nuclear transport factor 2 family protein [Sphingomonas profundi]|uniref:nuclear transport factor 2 family protein n=1 Tax=Alterirhizorhabdus profundi TaxID=2681549 RepID=UPI0012E6FD19|nr:nuclear transport factor 2 family protein [Sphingomonas profundi]
MSREENIALATRYLTAMSAGAWETVEAMYHDDIVVHMAGATPASGKLVGKEAVTGDLIARQVHAALDPARMHFARRWKIMCADEERVTIIMEGGGPTLSGDVYDQTYCEIFRFLDGRMIEMHAFYDTVLIERCLFANPLARPRPALPPLDY